jgi:hypothetical protein
MIYIALEPEATVEYLKNSLCTLKLFLPAPNVWTQAKLAIQFKWIET